MPTSQQKQALRDHRRMHGLCVFCGDLAISGQTRCESCKAKDNANRKRYAERDVSLGICKNVGCSNPVTHPKRYCDTCNRKSAQRTNDRRGKWLASNLCYSCGIVPPMQGRTRCNVCNAKVLAGTKKLFNKRVAQGLCGKCGAFVLEKGYKQCRECIDHGRNRHAALKLEVLAAYGGPVCVGCGETEICVLQIDHTDGGGGKHAKEIGGRGKMYLWLKKNKYPAGFRVLCANCNVRAARKKPFPNQS
jgi:hypothetical protein